jgi:hypothetical protein
VTRTEAQLDELWLGLADEDDETAYQAVWDMVESGDAATRLLSRHVRPSLSADAPTIARLVRELDSPRFRVRQQAEEDLERLDESAEAALKGALAGAPPPELRRRVARLLEQVEQSRRLRPRALRAVEVLEHIGSAEAVKLLRELAAGRPDAPLTRVAREALERSFPHQERHREKE